MGYLDGDVQRNSESHALIFVHKYVEYLISDNEKNKREYLLAREKEFLKKYSRARVQELVDSRMAMCSEESPAY